MIACDLLYCICCHLQQILNVRLRILHSVYSLWILGVFYELKGDFCGNYFRPSDCYKVSATTLSGGFYVLFAVHLHIIV